MGNKTNPIGFRVGVYEPWRSRWYAKDKEKDKSRLIDKLAAKVLDFDLKYIQKRLGDN